MTVHWIDSQTWESYEGEYKSLSCTVVEKKYYSFPNSDLIQILIKSTTYLDGIRHRTLHCHVSNTEMYKSHLEISKSFGYPLVICRKESFKGPLPMTIVINFRKDFKDWYLRFPVEDGPNMVMYSHYYGSLPEMITMISILNNQYPIDVGINSQFDTQIENEPSSLMQFLLEYIDL